MNDLNPNQWKFIEHYLTGKTAAESARLAGYAAASAAQQGSRLLKEPSVQAAIKEAREASQKVATYNYEVAMAETDSAIKFAKETKNANAMVRAIEHKAKLSGLLIEKHEVSQVGFQVNIIGLSQPSTNILVDGSPLDLIDKRGEN